MPKKLPPRVAIIGAGLTGSVLASRLKCVATVKVIEKARGVGGRLSTRKVGKMSFDHGAQYFTIRANAFESFCKELYSRGLIAPWSGPIASIPSDSESSQLSHDSVGGSAFVAVPGMSSLCKEILGEVDTVFEAEVAELIPLPGRRWHLRDQNGNGLGDFDAVVSTAPLAQTLKLFSRHCQIEAHFADDLPTLEPCFALLMGFSSQVYWEFPWNKAFVRSGPLQWIGLNHTKPGRDPNIPCFIVHSSSEWASQHLDRPSEENLKVLSDCFQKISDVDVALAAYVALHRWRFARTRNAAAEPFLDYESMLFATGDWVSGSRIEDVWLSAVSFADQFVASLSRPSI